MVIRSAGRHRARRRGEQEPRAEGPSAHDGSKAAAKPHRIPTHSISTHPNPSHGTHDGENSAVWLQPQEGTARHGTAMQGTAQQCTAMHSTAAAALSCTAQMAPRRGQGKASQGEVLACCCRPPPPPAASTAHGMELCPQPGASPQAALQSSGLRHHGKLRGVPGDGRARSAAQPGRARLPGPCSCCSARLPFAALLLGTRLRAAALRAPRPHPPPPHPQPPAAAGRRHRGLKGAGRARRFPPSRRSSLPALGLRAPSRPGAAPAPARRPRPRAALSFPPSTGDLLPPRPPSPHVSPLFPRSGSLRPALPCLPLSFPSSPASGPGWDLRARRGGGEERAPHRTAPHTAPHPRAGSALPPLRQLPGWEAGGGWGGAGRGSAALRARDQLRRAPAVPPRSPRRGPRRRCGIGAARTAPPPRAQTALSDRMRLKTPPRGFSPCGRRRGSRIRQNLWTGDGEPQGRKERDARNYHPAKPFQHIAAIATEMGCPSRSLQCNKGRERDAGKERAVHCAGQFPKGLAQTNSNWKQLEPIPPLPL